MRVDIEAWGDHPAFRVGGKNFVFSDQAARHLSVKLTTSEAAAAVATEPWVTPAAYGLGHHGWVSLTLDDPETEDRWGQVEEWVRISYALVAPAGWPRWSWRPKETNEKWAPRPPSRSIFHRQWRRAYKGWR